MIFKVYLILTFFISLIKGQSCPKDLPIFKDGHCSLTYCTYDNYNDGTCVMANEIIKTQWLKYRHTLGEKNCRYFSIDRSFKNDLIFESSYEGNDLLAKRRFFYGYNEGGRELFYDKSKEKDIYAKTMFIKEINVQKHFSELSFFRSAVNPLSCCVVSSFIIYIVRFPYL